MDVVVVVMVGDEDDESSSRQPNRQRQRGPRGQNLLKDYFIDRPIFSKVDFRRRSEDDRRYTDVGIMFMCGSVCRAHKDGRINDPRVPEEVEWKNCLTSWQGAYSGRKGHSTIILEAVASYDTWIWHSFIGVPGAQNDINFYINQTFLICSSPESALK
ncbi:hypothetical protein QQ045_023080 [Rhodiola kirilowii]